MRQPDANAEAGVRGSFQEEAREQEQDAREQEQDAREQAQDAREQAQDARATSIELGAETFAGLMRRFGRNPALALAGYNAGGGTVAAWLKTRGSLELDEFVEEIPIAETRGYVRSVLRSYNTYRLLYGGKATVVALGVAVGGRTPANPSGP